MKPAGPSAAHRTRTAARAPSVFTVVPAVTHVDGRRSAAAVHPTVSATDAASERAEASAGGAAQAVSPAPRPPLPRAALPAADVGPPQGTRYRWILLVVIGSAVLGFGSLMTLVTASLTPIAEELGTNLATAGWVLTGLMLAMAVSTPAGGKLADRFGHRRIFLVGLVGMTSMMAANVWVPTIESFIAVRVLFGLCGGMLMPSAMALLMHAFGPAKRAQAVGWFQLAMTGAPTVGVVVGGPLLDVVGWRGVFAMFAVISLAATAFAVIVVKPIPRGARVPIDVLGALLLAGSVGCVLLAITQVPRLSNAGAPVLTNPLVQILLGVSLACGVLFVLWERRTRHPLLELRLLRRPSFALPLIAAPANQFAYMGAFMVVPAMLQTRYGYSVGAAALLMVPRPGAFALASPLGGGLVSRIGPRLPMFFGTVAMVGSMVAFAAGSEPGGIALALVVVGLVLSGLSAGIGSPGYQVLVANSVDESDLGLANGMNQMVMWIGIIMGIQSMLAFAGDDPSLGRLRATFLFGAAVATVGLIAPLFATRRATRAG